MSSDPTIVTILANSIVIINSPSLLWSPFWSITFKAAPKSHTGPFFGKWGRGGSNVKLPKTSLTHRQTQVFIPSICIKFWKPNHQIKIYGPSMDIPQIPTLFTSSPLTENDGRDIGTCLWMRCFSDGAVTSPDDFYLQWVGWWSDRLCQWCSNSLNDRSAQYLHQLAGKL